MTRISYVDYDQASNEVKKAYDRQKEAAGGYVTNMKRTLMRSLPVYTALMQWDPLYNEIEKFIGKRGASIFSYAISSENECILCSLYFRKRLKELGISPESFELTEVEELLVAFGQQIARDAKNISEETFSRLKQHFSEEQIVSLVGFAVIMVATNLVNNTLKVEIDDNLRL